jgi:hypothetical protein
MDQRNRPFDGIPADLFYSAPTAEQAAVEHLITDVGLRPAYVGVDRHDVVDGVLSLWIALVQGARQQPTRRLAVLID